MNDSQKEVSVAPEVTVRIALIDQCTTRRTLVVRLDVKYNTFPAN